MNQKIVTPIMKLGDIENNALYIKRDDLFPYSFGGNKARKGQLFFREIDNRGFNCVVTYGTSHSNHCRIVANMCAERKIPCYIISPEEASDPTFNSRFMRMFKAHIIMVPVEKVHETIERQMHELQKQGVKAYFIPGGGHGNLGTHAFVECYNEVKEYEKEQNRYFDYIFFATGTGTTHAGLICGQIINGDNRKIVGISIARKNPRGRNIVIESVKDYLNERKIHVSDRQLQEITIFVDDYVGSGYGKEDENVLMIIKDVMTYFGVPLDSTYTGKAFYGMKHYIREHKISGKSILFLHTGGTPLFFDDIERFE